MMPIGTRYSLDSIGVRAPRFVMFLLWGIFVWGYLEFGTPDVSFIWMTPEVNLNDVVD